METESAKVLRQKYACDSREITRSPVWLEWSERPGRQMKVIFLEVTESDHEISSTYKLFILNYLTVYLEDTR